MQDFPSETDYQTIGTTKYKTHATKTKTNVTSAEMMGMIMELENKKDVPEEVINKKIFDLHERFDAMEDFKLDENPLSLNDYVNYVKDNPSKTIVIMDPKTGYPKFVLKYHGDILSCMIMKILFQNFMTTEENRRIKEYPKNFM